MSDIENNGYKDAFEILSRRLSAETLYFEQHTVQEPFLPSFNVDGEGRGHTIYKGYCSDLDEAVSKNTGHYSIMITPKEAAYYSEKGTLLSDNKKFESSKMDLDGELIQDFAGLIGTQFSIGRLSFLRPKNSKRHVFIRKGGIIILYVAHKENNGLNNYFCHSYYFANSEERKNRADKLLELMSKSGEPDFVSFHLINGVKDIDTDRLVPILRSTETLTSHFHENWGSKELQLKAKLQEKELAVRIGNEMSHDLFNRLGDIRSMLSDSYDHFEDEEYDRLEELLRIAESATDRALGVPWLTRFKNKPGDVSSIWDADMVFEQKMGAYWESYFKREILSILIGEGRNIKYGGPKLKHLNVTVSLEFNYEGKRGTVANNSVLSVRDGLGGSEPIWDRRPLWPLAFLRNKLVEKDGQKAIFTYANNELVRNAVRFGIANFGEHSRHEYQIDVSVHLNPRAKQVQGSVRNFLGQDEISGFVMMIEDKMRHIGCGFEATVKRDSDSDGNVCHVDWTLNLAGRKI